MTSSDYHTVLIYVHITLVEFLARFSNCFTTEVLGLFKSVAVEGTDNWLVAILFGL